MRLQLGGHHTACSTSGIRFPAGTGRYRLATVPWIIHQPAPSNHHCTTQNRNFNEHNPSYLNLFKLLDKGGLEISNLPWHCSSKAAAPGVTITRLPVITRMFLTAPALPPPPPPPRHSKCRDDRPHFLHPDLNTSIANMTVVLQTFFNKYSTYFSDTPVPLHVKMYISQVLIL